MQDHKCRRCGKCCTQLTPSNPGAPGGLLLTPEEASLFKGIDGKDVIPTVAYSIPGDDRKRMLYYGMVNTICPLYDNGCTVYENRPKVCRRYPLGSNITIVNSACPVVADGGILFTDESLTAMFDINNWASVIMSNIPEGSILYLWNVENNNWDIEGVKI